MPQLIYSKNRYFLTPAECEEMQSMIEDINNYEAAHNNAFNDTEMEFVNKTLENYESYGDNMFCTPKQWSWFKQLYNKLMDFV